MNPNATTCTPGSGQNPKIYTNQRQQNSVCDQSSPHAELWFPSSTSFRLNDRPTTFVVCTPLSYSSSKRERVTGVAWAEAGFQDLGKAVSRKGRKSASTSQIRALRPQSCEQRTRPCTAPWLFEKVYGKARTTMTSSFGPCEVDSVSTEDSLETCDSYGWYSVARRGRQAPRYSWVGHGC